MHSLITKYKTPTTVKKDNCAFLQNNLHTCIQQQTVNHCLHLKKLLELCKKRPKYRVRMGP